MAEFRPLFQLSNVNGGNGFKITGEAAYDLSGFSVASACNINGDGFDDLIIGAPNADTKGISSGASYVVFGHAGGFSAGLDLSTLNGSNGFQISGEAAGDQSGFSVSSAGDINGDGLADLLIGAPFADPNGSFSGASYVVFGHAGGFSAELDLSTLNGSNGFHINGEVTQDGSGHSVSSAGDVNGDGFDDLIVGAFRADPNGSYSGASYVVFGRAGSFAANLNLSSLDGSNGFQISGEVGYDESGFSVSSAGDVNGDGFDDLLIGAPNAYFNGPNGDYGDFGGLSYVVFGKASGFGANLNLSSLNGANGFKINPEAAYDFSGHSVSGAGDVNGDGFDDILVGAPYRSDGASYVVFGKASGFAADLYLSQLNGSNGFKIAGDSIGGAVASAGDVNGDGFDDVIVGGGRGYVVFGKASGFAAELDVSSLNGATGFRIAGETTGDFRGRAVSSAEDVNDDGFDDLIIGAPFVDANDVDSGASYVIFGHRALEAVTRVGTAIDNTINGGRGSDTISGRAGNDILLGWEGTDLLLGGTGRDRLSGQSGSDRLVGGANRDILIGSFGADVFDFNNVTDSSASVAGADIVRDFHHLVDRIDLSDLSNLSFIGTADFTATGQVRVAQLGSDTVVQINLAGPDTAEMSIALRDVSAATLTEADFIL